jgi:hypothetical protein
VRPTRHPPYRAPTDRHEQEPTTEREGGSAHSLAHDLKAGQVGGDRQLRDAVDRVRVARSVRTAHVAKEGFYGREVALDVDEDRAIGLVSDTADHAVTTRRLRDPRAVIDALDASLRKAVPVHQRGHTHSVYVARERLCITTARSAPP